MPRRDDIQSILIIGAGPIIIGQACEFDYSGTQACKALRDEGYRVILVNSNPATIMTDPEMADATYIEPITPDIIAKIIDHERPHACLATMGGQTALNTALALSEDGTFEKYGVELIGANKQAIAKAEDRQRFRECMDELGLESPVSKLVNSLDEARTHLRNIGLPAIIRPSYTLGGTGGGIAYNRDEYERIIAEGLDASPISEVLIEESVLGWKEFEMEVVRDKSDNAIIICAIENIDPMGVHTGDSITVAPTLTLTDKEYQIMRSAAITVLRGIGVETGGSNVQFAVHPETGRMVVIEMNPRVSRSSALASKATGYPIAKIAAKLAVGYTLDELGNDITGGVTPASFEPTLDYVVTKIPRFGFEKFRGADNNLTTAMKSVGEVMAIGRNFAESVQKALRSLEKGLSGFDEVTIGAPAAHQPGPHPDQVRAALAKPTPQRILYVAQALRHGFSPEDINAVTHYDYWFLRQIEAIVGTENRIREQGLPDTPENWLDLKQMGFSDARLAALTGLTAEDVSKARQAHDIAPSFKRVDTCAGEIPSATPYMYSSHESLDHAAASEIDPCEREKVVILGSGPNRIGQGIEFDYCCVHAAFALKDAGYETIMINCNPETVSTDYDTADRLYFEPLTAEDVMAIIRAEGPVKGVIVQLGGQTPLKLARDLEAAGVPILGTAPEEIDRAEDREHFQALLNDCGLRQPPNALARSKDEARQLARELGYPLVIRPSYVLGGAAMEIVHNEDALERYITSAVHVAGDSPILLDRYLKEAIEIDVDAICDGADVYVAGIMEHIEEAGIHSGDSACVCPPHSLPYRAVREIEKQTVTLAKALNVKGLINVQFAAKRNRDTGEYDILIIEANPRASRTVPFVAKATGVPVAKIAARIMAGAQLADFREAGMLSGMDWDHMAVKAPVFPFNRFPGVDPVLGPEMKSTGEVMGLDRELAHAFAKSQLAAGTHLPDSGTVFLSVKDADKDAIVPIARELTDMGFELLATGGTCRHLREQGLEVQRVNKVMEGQPHIVDAIINGEIDFMINTTKGPQAVADSFSIRRNALMHKIPYYTLISAARSGVQAIRAMRSRQLAPLALQDYFTTDKATGRRSA